MINQELYNKTVKVLHQAYLKGTLKSGDCTACACGNLVAAANNYEIVTIKDNHYWKTKDKDYLSPIWNHVVGTISTTVTKRTFFGLKPKINRTTEQYFRLDKYNESVKKEISSTGYDLEDFALIESAFEKGYTGSDKMFNALISVIDCLDKIHKNTDATITKDTKKLFELEIYN